MSALAAHLAEDVPRHHRSEDANDWNAIADLIKQYNNLETALLERPPGQDLEAVIVASTARLIAAAETTTIQQVFTGVKTLRLTRLVPHLLMPRRGIPVITTNYDRLVEIAFEEAGLGVDTMFSGAFAGCVNEAEAKMSLCKSIINVKGKARLEYKSCAIVSKPHGSLDWYDRRGTPVRYAGDLLDTPRLIVPPGRNKYQTGYAQPFDQQRERANRAIDDAARLLILGYGFADAHLETHLAPVLDAGRPALVLTWSLSDKARSIAVRCPAVTAIERVDDNTIRVFRGGVATELAAPPIWDLANFINEVLEP